MVFEEDEVGGGVFLEGMSSLRRRMMGMRRRARRVMGTRIR